MRVRASSWTRRGSRFARGGMGRFADRQILTVVNLRLPIPVVERFGDGVILVPRFPEIRGVRLRADWIYGMAGRGDREY